MTIKLIAIYRFLNCNHNEGPIKNIVRNAGIPKCRSRMPQLKEAGEVRRAGNCAVCVCVCSPHTRVCADLCPRPDAAVKFVFSRVYKINFSDSSADCAYT